MAHKMGAGSTKNNRDSNPKYLGLKFINNKYIYAGNIILRQKGNKYKAGPFVGQGKDFTLYALKNGILCYLSTNNSITIF